MKPDRGAALYREIVRDFGFDEAADERAAALLSGLLASPVPLERLERRLEGADVHVLGASSALGASDLRALPRPLVATDGSCGPLAAAGVVPDVVVTDLDGDVAAERVFSALGAIVAVAAHGDNVPALRAVAPTLPRAIGTSQVPGESLPGVVRVPGFTDGDRACFLAAAAGARRVTLHAFDFGTPGPSSRDPATKRRKLAWARRLLDELPVPWTDASR